MRHKHQLILRPGLLDRIERSLTEAMVTVLLGARQTGKTTLARLYAEKRADSQKVHYFDLERPTDLTALSNPELTLRSLEGLVIIDEVQRRPELFSFLRPLTDRTPQLLKFLLLGSASPTLVKGVSESLAGRALFINVPGFSLQEVGATTNNEESLWLRGGFPRSWLALNNSASLRWRESFVATFLERDLPQLGIRIPAETLRRFWYMLCHYHGQIWNASEVARSISVTEKTARHYLDILVGTYVMRTLPPWYENIGKRQVKSPKVYVRDSGLLHALLGIETPADLRAHPKYGASWEGFSLEQVLMLLGDQHAFFWGTHRGAELDLLIIHHGRRYGFEFKCQDAPTMTRSLHVALEDLRLEKAFVIYPGERQYLVHDKVRVVPLQDFIANKAGL